MVGWTERSPLVEGPPLPVDSENLPPLPLPQPQIPVGGRLAHFALNWQNITNDQWVLSLIKNGYQIPFKDQPPLSREPIFFQQSQRRELEEEVTSLLQKGAVEEIQPETPGFYSRIFLVPKKNGKLRLIIDLSTLNKYVFAQSFRMETQRKVRNAIRQNDWAFSLDLTDAYLHVPIHPRSRKYLRFTLKGRVFHFRALPFGLSTSPYIFTLLMTVIATYLRRRAIILHPYLDDWLSRNQSRLILLEHRHFIIQLITSLGLIINQEKSDLIPTQMFTFIGMEFLTHMNIVRVPQARVQILLETVKKFSQKTYVSAREFLSLLGQLNAAAAFVMLGRLHLRPLQMSLLAQWRPQTLPLQHQIKLTADVLHHLNWWKQHRLYLQGVPMKADPPSHHIFSDASLTGWGSHLEPEGLLYHGVWSKTQSRLHINILEMMAISLTLRRALQFIKNSTVLISTDNTTVVAYLNRQGGTHSPDLCMEVWKTLIWCHQNQINLLIKHIPGKFNVLADRLSRITKPISTEWGLNQSVANAVFRMTQFPNLDLFATRLNHKLPLYVSPIPDQKALSIDALTMNWNHIHGYAFPPFHLIPSVINKIRTAQCKVVLIAPFWPNRTWFPELLNLLISSPITLPIRPNLLEQLHGKFLHQNPGLLQLHAWELSNNPSEIKKISKEVADHVSRARRESTRKVYDAKWRVFVDWTNQKQINPIKASPTVIADFLIFLFRDKKCQVSTIKGYRSTISNTLKFKSGYDIGSHPIISELIKSFETQRPVERSLAPKWDLSLVLSHICKAPFEPLHEASLLHLSMKTAFLLTMATARRVSEVHAFAIDKEHFRFSNIDGSLIIRTQVGFLAKNQLPTRAPDSIKIPKLSNFCARNDSFSRLLCPIRAIKVYLKRTKILRKNRNRLFIPTRGDHDINKSTISKWVKYTIKHAYKAISTNQIKLLKIRAHELRALSASWAYFNFIPLDEIIKAAVWSNSSIFASHYLRDFSSQTSNLHDIGPVVVAQKVVGGANNQAPCDQDI